PWRGHRTAMQITATCKSLAINLAIFVLKNCRQYTVFDYESWILFDPIFTIHGYNKKCYDAWLQDFLISIYNSNVLSCSHQGQF
ncbi:MAG: hypothetical protein M3162_04210, partial [Thermoproteota archaeon]|nr:hypothetical protein [Thermoproteota archaeon]